MPREAIEQGLADAQWPARLELIQLDERASGAAGRRAQPRGRAGARGLPAAMAPRTSAAGHWRDARQERGGDRDTLLPHVSSVIATAAPTPRAIPPDDLARHLRAAGAERRDASSPTRRAPSICALEQAPMVCVAGSIFLVGAVRDGLRQRAILR